MILRLEYSPKFLKLQVLNLSPKVFSTIPINSGNAKSLSETEETKKAKILLYQSQYRENNREKIALINRQYRENNREKIALINRQYYEKNREKMAQYQKNNKEKLSLYLRQRYEKNKENIALTSRQYQQNNKEKIALTKRLYYEKNKGKLQACYVQKKKTSDPNYVYNPHPPSYDWKDSNSLKCYFDGVGPSMGITQLSSWYRVSCDQILKNGGAGLLSRYRHFGFALKLAYPDFEWDMLKFPIRNKKSGQAWLVHLMKQLVTGIDIVEDYRKHPLLKKKDTGRIFELDIWIESLNLALEYQGEQHYIELPGSGCTPLAKRQSLDREKKELCSERGIILVQIPHWWDGMIESLSSTLHQYLPEFFPKTSSPPISPELPLNYKSKKVGSIPHIKAIMQGYDREEKDGDPKGWIMSEKLDGIRAYWDGNELWSKNGRVINAPDWFKARLPSYSLDGELWSGYTENDLSLHHIKVLCREKKVNIDHWSKIKFCVFDVPSIEAIYPQRHLFLQNNIPQYNNPNISLIPIVTCKGETHLQNHLEKIVKKGGEGIMIYRPDSLYQPGRSRVVLKVKKYYECNVTFLKLSGRSYSFICTQENGETCKVNCSYEFCCFPPTAGEILRVRHLGLSHSRKYKYPSVIEVESVKPDIKPQKIKNIEENLDNKMKKIKVNETVQ